jgi:hypothetical protein
MFSINVSEVHLDRFPSDLEKLSSDFGYGECSTLFLASARSPLLAAGFLEINVRDFDQLMQEHATHRFFTTMAYRRVAAGS